MSCFFHITCLIWNFLTIKKHTFLRNTAPQGLVSELVCNYTVRSQKNGAVSKVNKKFIYHLTRANLTPSAAATVPVSHVLITILQCVHPVSHDTHSHVNQIHPRLGVACPL